MELHGKITNGNHLLGFVVRIHLTSLTAMLLASCFIWDKLINWILSVPENYWQLLGSYCNVDDRNNIPNLRAEFISLNNKKYICISFILHHWNGACSRKCSLWNTCVRSSSRVNTLAGSWWPGDANSSATMAFIPWLSSSRPWSGVRNFSHQPLATIEPRG